MVLEIDGEGAVRVDAADFARLFDGDDRRVRVPVVVEHVFGLSDLIAVFVDQLNLRASDRECG